jgi:hypothetical protein
MVTSVRRVAALLVTVLLAVAGTAVAAPGAAAPAGAQVVDFYTPPSPLPAGGNGDVIRSERITYANATATRIMYLSRDNADRPMAVTGTVLVPTAPWTGGGQRPIVAYAPFTAGLGDQCAVSRLVAGGLGDFVSGVQTSFINNLLGKGIAVAQTDYQGLGTPGDHTYVVRKPQAHAVLDVVRAAQRLPGTGLPASGPVGIAGYSQGGGAAAAAAELEPTYAPELDLRGVYAGAPVADLGPLATSLDGSFYFAFLGFALIGMDAAYDSVDLNTLANATGRQVIQTAKGQCTFDAVFAHGFRQSSSLTADGRPASAYLAQEPFRSIVAENRVGTLRPTAPVLIEHSSLDDVLPQTQGRSLAQAWCSRGATVQFNDLFTFIPIFVHLLQATTSATNAANWLAGRFAGTPATSNCGLV